jgi:predicted dehydrogenase
MSDTVRVAVVGAGHLGRHHARLYAALPQAELVGVADVRPERARQVAEAYGAQAFADYRDAIEQVDAASIAVPTESHFAVARDFIERGRPVLIEKPMARSLGEADHLLELADARGVPIQVGHIERFNPALLAAREHLTRPLYIVCERRGPFSFRSLDIGVVLDLMIHDLDILLDLVAGQVSSVEAVGVPVLTPHEDIANARITFADEQGAMTTVAALTASRVATQAVRQVHIFQPDAYIALDYGQRTAQLYRKRPDAPDPTEVDPRDLEDVKGFVFDRYIAVQDLPMADHNALEEELASFLRCVAEGERPACSGHDARRALALACQILENIHQNLESHPTLGGMGEPTDS